MDNIIFDDFILIIDSKDISGLPLWCSYLKKASFLNFDIDCVLCVNTKDDFPTEYFNYNKVSIHETFENFLNIDDFYTYLTNLSVNASKQLLFIDSINILVKKFGISKTNTLLYKILQNKIYLAIVSTVNESIISIHDLNLLSSYPSIILQLEANLDNLKKGFCRSIKKKKDGLLSEKLEDFEIISFSILAFAVTNVRTVTELIKNAATKKETTKEPYNSLPFDIGLSLSETELAAKANVKLPYINVQNEKGLVGINISSGKQIRAGGQIVYTPDKDDDLDDSDPDDDLMI